MLDEKVKYHNIFVVVGLQVICVLLYYIGPINYTNSEKSFVVGFYIFWYMGCYLLGYWLVGNRYFKGRSGPRDISRYVKFASVTSLIFSTVTLVGILSQSSGDISNLGDLYAMSHKAPGPIEVYASYAKMAFGYYLFALFPVLLLYRIKLPTKTRRLGYCAIGIAIFTSLLEGINRDLFNMLILAVCLKLMPRITRRDLWRKSTLRFGMLIAVGGVIGLAYFTAGQLTRFGSPAITGADNRTGMYSMYNAADGKILVGYSALSSYLTQGYHALELSNDLPFRFTGGIGNSTFFSRQVDRLLGSKIEDDSYPARLAPYGWDVGIDWSSFYVWWGSDVSLPGVGILLLLFGMLFRLAENTGRIQGDVASICLYCYLLIMGFYFSANNQIFQSGESAIGFLWVFGLMIFGRKIAKRRS